MTRGYYLFATVLAIANKAIEQNERTHKRFFFCILIVDCLTMKNVQIATMALLA